MHADRSDLLTKHFSGRAAERGVSSFIRTATLIPTRFEKFYHGWTFLNVFKNVQN